jgi:hypothetical protein
MSRTDIQISAGDFEDQTVGTGQIGRRDFADGYFAEDKPNSMNAGGGDETWPIVLTGLH